MYPILLDILPSLEGIMMPSTANAILDTYFNRSAWGGSFLVRKVSFLTFDPAKVRKTKPTLLYAMLCYASQHHGEPGREFLDVRRGNATDKLFELASSSVVSFHKLDDEAELDDVISHIQLASMLSGSKYQKKSIEWWSAAYQLARQLRLNEEYAHGEMSAEEREERRRTWWLLYCVDRHQALSVRKSLAFRDAEGHELLRPCEDRLWNSADDFSPWNSAGHVSPTAFSAGLTYRVEEGSFFGLMVPLMRILGDIIDLYNLQEVGEDTEVVDRKRAAIHHHLETYDESLGECAHSTATQLDMCYARHTVSTLHILSVAKWDPLDVLTDVEESGLSQDVIYSAAMATVAANTAQEIASLDGDLSHMPLFFGTFLLQCSFPLLLLLKTFGAQSDENIIGGCETILAAHMILSRYTERMAQNPHWTSPYWSSFAAITREIKESRRSETSNVARRSMRDVHDKTREILGLFRWNKTGHGVNT